MFGMKRSYAARAKKTKVSSPSSSSVTQIRKTCNVSTFIHLHLFQLFLYMSILEYILIVLAELNVLH